MDESNPGPARILVVDDERGPRESLRMILTPHHEVRLARSGSQALEMLGAEPVDVVTLDLNNRIQLLVEDEMHFLRRNARLLGLIRRHSSYLQIKKVVDEYVDGQELFVVADEIAWCRKPRSDHRQFTCNTNDAATARHLQNRFDEVWERSDDMPEIHSLGL